MDDIISKQLQRYLKLYLEMDIMGKIINCPYWSNKIKNNQVLLRGFLNGKGNPEKIKEKLIERIKKSNIASEMLSIKFINKFAKRERIGIDCSGLAYRLLDKLVKLHYRNCSFSSLDNIFKQGINKVNADLLCQFPYSIKIEHLKDIQIGDLIRMMGGGHVAVIVSIEKDQIAYIHSSHLSEIQGVHLSKIIIIDQKKSLKDQRWIEKTKSGDNFGAKYFKKEKGDGIFRLRIFS